MTTTIRLEESTKAALDKIGKSVPDPRPSYDDIIKILLVRSKAAELSKAK